MKIDVPNGYSNNTNIQFNRDCALCNLSRGEAVFGAGPEDLGRIKLIIISDNPGPYEVEKGYPLVYRESQRKPNVIQKWNTAGTYMRNILHSMGLDSYKDCWITNAIKCEKREKTVEQKHINTCAISWLKKELDILDCHVPTVPILILGKLAFKAIKVLEPQSFPKDTVELKDYRKKKGVFYRLHPLVFTVNPAAVSNCIPRIETHEIDDNYVRNVREIQYPIGSPPWFFMKDLELLKEYLD